MDAKDKKQLIQLSEAAGALALHAVAENIHGVLEKVYELGFEAGKVLGFDTGRAAGIEEGKATAAAIVSGLRALLGLADGTAAIPPAFESLSAGYEAPKDLLERSREYRAAKDARIADAPGYSTLAEDGRQIVGRELVDLSTGEIIEERAEEFPRLAEIEEEIAGDQVAAESAKLLENNPGVNFPGYFPLDVPVGDCSICQGLGTVEGSLYGQVCMIPCSLCEAGQKVAEIGELGLSAEGTQEIAEDFPEVAEPGAAADAFEEFAEAIETAEQEAAGSDQVEGPTAEGDFETFCFRLACVNHDTKAATGCKVLEYVAECEHRVGPLEVLCGNTSCGSCDASKMTRCYAVADMAELGTVQPVTSCGKFKAIPAAPFTPTFSEKLPTSSPAADAERVEYKCCAECSITDPDCSACHLIELEIEERNAAEKIATAPPAELEKCGNGSCTATGRDAKQICLRVGHPDQPAKDCKSFVPLADCKHDPSKRYNDESGSLMCGVCSKVIQASRRAAAGETSPEAKGTAHAERELTPNEEKMKALQANCKHPSPFIKVIPGRGEVCEVCDLVLTPESLPLPFEEKGGEIADAGTYFTAGEELDQVEECDHLPESVRYEEDGKTLCGLCGAEVPAEIEEVPVKECDHPADCRRPEPVLENGVKVGSLIKCGECGQVVARFDNERKPIPRELWPETGGKLDAANIRKAGYKPSELKMIKAGFALIRYYREKKELVKTCNDPSLGWYTAGVFKTYADAERKLAEELANPRLVQVDESGFAHSKSESKLRAAGFEFYRKEKGAEGVSPKIKQGSKNWGMHSKYKTDAELETAWKKLLTEDPLALEG